MRELDTRAQNLMKSIDEKADDFMKTLMKDKDSVPEEVRKEKLKAIQDMFNRTKEYGDDKVQLAIQTYELVDKHIRRLDSDLARFEGEIQDKTLSTYTVKPEEPVVKRKLVELDNFSFCFYSYRICFVLFFRKIGGRKRIKDTKAPVGKKKRVATGTVSSEDEARPEVTKTPKSTKKQKVNQEKETRKNQKVNHSSIIQLIHNTFLYSIEVFS